jgi:hypothetical protein
MQTPKPNGFSVLYILVCIVLVIIPAYFVYDWTSSIQPVHKSVPWVMVAILLVPSGLAWNVNKDALPLLDLEELTEAEKRRLKSMVNQASKFLKFLMISSVLAAFSAGFGFYMVTVQAWKAQYVLTAIAGVIGLELCMLYTLWQIHTGALRFTSEAKSRVKRLKDQRALNARLSFSEETKDKDAS